jgi:Uma2 family endonuclease
VKVNRLIPDLAVIRKDRFATEAIDGYHAVAPDLAVEVISPTDKMKSVQRKVSRYLEADVPVWLVNPKEQTITVYDPDGEMHTYRKGETLVGTGILEGFTLNLTEVFVV